jgi:hypothetical protein
MGSVDDEPERRMIREAGEDAEYSNTTRRTTTSTVGRGLESRPEILSKEILWLVALCPI